MATILSQMATVDGYDVRILTDDGQAEVLHFAQRPADVDAAVAAILQAREAARLVFVIAGEAD